jgi:hypothetical protein
VIPMEFILIPVAFIAVLVAVLMWLRRGQSSIGGESGDTTYEARRKAQDKGDGTRPRSMTRRAIAERRATRMAHWCSRRNAIWCQSWLADVNVSARYVWLVAGVGFEPT